MQTNRAKRRVQFVCAVFLHIPLVAIAAYAISEGFMDHLRILLVGLVATLLGTGMIVPYIGRVLEGGEMEPSA
ncbi:hypothetical protein SAMN06297129_2422 [Pseudooceanicola antarcticus]|uniref:Uncharacterized protein n=1 Tax=Pseudooceanicola antarcticus TaxID=1247613 RepID=A0A285IXT1_9RHOB|nr:hypothetical protein [Pseudooceanicola antarcticus]SNY52855.1 hypothetical protein SAMN06297129_2422 [Pseudooceanicola antarcticus]